MIKGPNLTILSDPRPEALQSAPPDERAPVTAARGRGMIIVINRVRVAWDSAPSTTVRATASGVLIRPLVHN